MLLLSVVGCCWVLGEKWKGDKEGKGWKPAFLKRSFDEKSKFSLGNSSNLST